MEHLKEFCTPRQLEIVEAVIKYPNKQLAACRRCFNCGLNCCFDHPWKWC